MSTNIGNSYSDLTDYFDILIQEQLRERCLELTLCLYAGIDVPDLVASVETLARDSWEIRDSQGGDN